MLQYRGRFQEHVHICGQRNVQHQAWQIIKLTISVQSTNPCKGRDTPTVLTGWHLLAWGPQGFEAKAQHAQRTCLCHVQVTTKKQVS